MTIWEFGFFDSVHCCLFNRLFQLWDICIFNFERSERKTCYSAGIIGNSSKQEEGLARETRVSLRHSEGSVESGVLQVEMKYRSSRGGINGVPFAKALLSGRAPDGGLYVPESIPRLTRTQLKEWSDFSYVQIVERILRYFVSTEELSSPELFRK